MNKIGRGIKIALLFVCLLPQIVSAQKIPTLTELIDSALRKDYVLANKELEIEAVKIDQQRLKDAYLPKVDVTGKEAFLLTSMSVKTPGLQIPQLGIAFPEGKNRYTVTSNLATVDVHASMLLYSGGKVPNLKKAVGEKINAQTAMLEKNRQDVISQIIVSYDQLGLLKEVRMVLNESERRLAESKRTADKAFGYGLITAYERQKVELAQAQLNSKIQEYEGKRQLILAQLHMLTEIEVERLALLDVNLQSYESINVSNDISNRAELKALDAAINANQYNVKAATSWWKPKVMASTSVGYYGLLYGHISSRDPMMLSGKKLSTGLDNINLLPVFNVGVGFKWDLFDGREGIHEVQKAKIELQIAENEKKEAVEKLELNLLKNQTDYNMSNDLVAVKKKQSEIAQNGMKQATQEYKEGLIKTSQLLEAETDLQNSSLEYVQAVFNQRRAAVELLKATGNLTVESFH